MGGSATREPDLIYVVREGGAMNLCGQGGWRHKCLSLFSPSNQLLCSFVYISKSRKKSR